MQPNETPCTGQIGQNNTGKPQNHLRGTYQKVLDGRKQPIRGLGIRKSTLPSQPVRENTTGFIAGARWWARIACAVSLLGFCKAG